MTWGIKEMMFPLIHPRAGNGLFVSRNNPPKMPAASVGYNITQLMLHPSIYRAFVRVALSETRMAWLGTVCRSEAVSLEWTTSYQMENDNQRVRVSPPTGT